MSFQQQPSKTRTPRKTTAFLLLTTAQIDSLDDGRKRRLAEEEHKHQPMQFCIERPRDEHFHHAPDEQGQAAPSTCHQPTRLIRYKPK